MLTEEQMNKLRLLKEVVDFTIAAQEVLSEPEPTDQPAVPADLIAFRTAVRNRVLAGSGEKAKWLGTLSTPPLYGKPDVLALGVTDAAATLLVACRDELRAMALALQV